MEGTDVTNPLTLPQGTVEYVKTPVTSDVTLDAQIVTISIDGKATWLPAVWTGSPGTQRTARTSSPVTFDTTGYRHVFVKVTDTPEIPIMYAGRIKVE